MKRLRAALDDDAETPRFIETLPRRGYRFIAPITANGTAAAAVTDTAENHRSIRMPESLAGTRLLLVSALLGTVMLLVAGGFWIYKHRETPPTPPQRTL